MQAALREIIAATKLCCFRWPLLLNSSTLISKIQPLRSDSRFSPFRTIIDSLTAVIDPAARC